MRRSPRERLSSSSRIVSAEGGEVTIAIDPTYSPASGAAAGDPFSSDLSSETSSFVSGPSSSRRRRRVLICRNPLVASSLTANFLSPDDPYYIENLSASPHRSAARFQTVLAEANNTSNVDSESEKDECVFKKPSLPPLPKRAKSSREQHPEEQSSQDQPSHGNRSVSSSSTSVSIENLSEPPSPPFPSETIVPTKTATRTTTSSADDYEGMAEVYEKARYLTNWVPVLDGKKFMVEGDLLDFSNVNPNHYQDRWTTSKISGRKTETVVMTKSSYYVLEGKLNISKAKIYQTPQFIIHAFLKGFPERWEMYRSQWRLFVNEQLTNNSNLSTISSVGNASAFLPRLLPLPLPSQNMLPAKTETKESQNQQVLGEEQQERVIGENEAKPIGRGRKRVATKKYPQRRRRSNNSAEQAKEETSRGRSPRKSLTITKNRSSRKSSTSQSPQKASKEPENQQVLGEEQQEEVVGENEAKPTGRGRKRVATKKYPQKRRGRNNSAEQAKEEMSRSRSPRKSLATTKNRSSRKSSTSQSPQKHPVVVPRIRSKANQKLQPNVPEETLEANSTRGRKRMNKKPENAPSKPSILESSSLPTRSSSRTSRKVPERYGIAADKSNLSEKEPTKRKIARVAKKPPAVKAVEGEENREKENKRNRGGGGGGPKINAVITKEITGEGDAELSKALAETKKKQVDITAKRLIANPKTQRDKIMNERIISTVNSNHQDDIFQSKGEEGKQSNGTSKPRNEGPVDIINDLFASDSENDLSVNTVRTPIGNYLSRSTRSQTPVNESDHNNESALKKKMKDRAFVNRKVQDTKRMCKLMKNKPSSPKQFDQTQHSLGVRKGRRKARTANPMDPDFVSLLQDVNHRLSQQEGDDEDDEFDEPYFSDGNETSAVHPPTGLWNEYQKEFVGFAKK